MSKLFPCPFCDSEDVEMNQTSVFWVSCCSCDAEGPSKPTQAEAISAWNRTPAPKAEPHIDCHKCGRPIHPRTIICSPCAEKEPPAPEGEK